MEVITYEKRWGMNTREIFVEGVEQESLRCGGR